MSSARRTALVAGVLAACLVSARAEALEVAGAMTSCAEHVLALDLRGQLWRATRDGGGFQPVQSGRQFRSVSSSGERLWLLGSRGEIWSMPCAAADAVADPIGVIPLATDMAACGEELWFLLPHKDPSTHVLCPFDPKRKACSESRMLTVPPSDARRSDARSQPDFGDLALLVGTQDGPLLVDQMSDRIVDCRKERCMTRTWSSPRSLLEPLSAGTRSQHPVPEMHVWDATWTGTSSLAILPAITHVGPRGRLGMRDQIIVLDLDAGRQVTVPLPSKATAVAGNWDSRRISVLLQNDAVLEVAVPADSS